MTRGQFKTFYDLETRWYDEDSLGHLNHGTVVAYFEDVRIRHANDLGFDAYNIDSFPFIIGSMKLDFYKQVRHPQKVQIGIRVSRLGNKSFDYEYGLFLEGENDCTIKCVTTLVCFDYVAQKTVPVFDVIKEQME